VDESLDLNIEGQTAIRKAEFKSQNHTICLLVACLINASFYVDSPANFR
jgi:enamine deaminase RidA (YjgF/YER057c/UK114 family)